MITNHIMFFYRICNKLHYSQVKQKNIVKKSFFNLLLIILNGYYRLLSSILYGAFIPYTAKIGNNIKFPHGLFGIFISMGAEIGNNCTIFHHVTIGSSKGYSPKIGDKVFIGCNSCIIGKVIIGTNCQIGAGTTVADAEIPDNSTVVGCQFRIVNEKIMDNK